MTRACERVLTANLPPPPPPLIAALYRTSAWLRAGMRRAKLTATFDTRNIVLNGALGQDIHPGKFPPEQLPT